MVADPQPSPPAFFRFRRLGERVVVTNQEGRFLVLGGEQFEQFRQGRVEPGTALHSRLAEQNLLRDDFDVQRAASELRHRRRFLSGGPNLHILVVTLRCNETCAYCHSSRAPANASGVDMTPEIAERSIDLALRTTSPSVTFELQGGEPLLCFDLVQHAVDYALARGGKLGKEVEITLVTNMAAMDEDKLAWLLDRRVQICTSVDGPADLHDAQRKLPGGSAQAAASRWIRRINEAYAEAGLDQTLYHVEALLTTTRATLPRWREVVDTYVELGCRALFLRPLDPFGFAGRARDRLAYSIDEFLDFYRNAVDYMIALNLEGVEILERFAAIFLTKILSGEDPNYLDIRNPCGAGIGQVAYNYDGKVYTCDEGRMLHEEGDETFCIGDVANSTYREVIGHRTVRALVLASALDGQPDCVHCAYQPYCGVCPVHNHKTQGTFFGRMRESSLCALHKGIQDYLFEKIDRADPEELRVLQRWTTVRARDHFLHCP